MIKKINYMNKMSSPNCLSCNKNLIKQWLNENKKPNDNYDEKISIIDFGKHEGKNFNDLTKKQISALLERRFVGMVVYIKHQAIYCNLHKFAEQKWPEWSDELSLLCKCRKGGKIWSCPNCGSI